MAWADENGISGFDFEEKSFRFSKILAETDKAFLFKTGKRKVTWLPKSVISQLGKSCVWYYSCLGFELRTEKLRDYSLPYVCILGRTNKATFVKSDENVAYWLPNAMILKIGKRKVKYRAGKRFELKPVYIDEAELLE